MKEHTRSFLEFVHGAGALQFGSFPLNSKRISPYFFNAGLFKSGSSMRTLGRLYAEAVQNDVRFKNPAADLLYGPAYKGIPIVISTAIACVDIYNSRILWCFNRKEEKDHGDGGILVGSSVKGMNVLILDDVITSGKSIHESVEIITKKGGTPCGVCISLDRQEKGTKSGLSGLQEIEQKYGIPVASIATLADVIEYCEASDELAEHVPNLIEYRTQYGVN